MEKKICVNDKNYALDEKRDGERLIIAMVDTSGLTFVGMCNPGERDENGFILIRNAQCIIRWWTGAHLNYLINGVCEGVTLGAAADVRISEISHYIEPDFASVADWKSSKQPKGKPEVI